MHGSTPPSVKLLFSEVSICRALQNGYYPHSVVYGYPQVLKNQLKNQFVLFVLQSTIFRPSRRVQK